MSEVQSEFLEWPEDTALQPFDFESERRSMLASFDHYIAEHEHPDGRIGKLTSMQTETFMRIRDFVAGQATHGLLQLPCGYGKSPLITTTADALGVGLTRPDHTRRQAIVATSRNSIVKQLVDRNVQYVEDEDDLDELMGDFAFFAPRVRPSVHNKFGKDMTGDAIVMPYHSLDLLIRNKAIAPGRFSVYLLDESQHLGKKRMRMLDSIGKHALLLGASATPGSSREYLPTAVDKVTLADGILKYGFLAGIKMFGVPTHCTFLPRGQAGGDYLIRDTGHLAKDPNRNQLIVQQIYANASLGPGLVKCSRRLPDGFSQLKVLADMANADAPFVTRNGKRRRLRVEPVSSAIKGSQERIDEFTYGDTIDALLFVDLIGEGFNMPRAKWGLWTPPTRSFDLLEQFVGRGVRRDPSDPDKIFHFTQLVDDVDLAVSRQARPNAMAWQLFDIPRQAQEATITREMGRTYVQRDKDTGFSHEVRVSQSGQSSAERLARLSLDASMVEANLPEEVITLDALQHNTKINRDLIKRVLFDGGYVAYARIVDDKPALVYDEASYKYIQDVFATRLDYTIGRVAHLFDMTPATALKWIRELDVSTTMLYPRSWSSARKQMHLTHEALIDFEHKLGQRVSALEPHEMKVREAREQAGAPKSTQYLSYFTLRGFTLEERKISTGRKAQLIGQRAELVPWIEKYRSAPSAPVGTHLLLSALTKLQLKEVDQTLEDVYIAVSRLGIRPEIFMRTQRERSDYVEKHHKDRIVQEIRRVAKQRIAAELDPSLQKPVMQGCIYGSDPALAASADLTEQTTISVAPDGSSDNESRIEHTVPDAVSIKLRQAIISRHPASQMLDPKSPDYAEAMRAILHNVLHRAYAPLPAIPRNWVFLDDLAAELSMAEPVLAALLIRKQVSSDHAKFVEFRGIRGMLGFCSPELAQALRDKNSV